MAAGNFKSIFDTRRADSQRLNCEAKILRWAGRGGKIENVIDMPRIEWSADIVLEEAKARLMGQMFQVVEASRGEVVNPNNLMTFTQQAIGKMRAKKTSGTGDEHMHRQKYILFSSVQVAQRGLDSEL